MSGADLIVIGGGPAGTAAAITAARSGARVMLFEAGRFPRHKVCGEFVSAESLELLRGLLASRDTVLRHARRIGHARLFMDERVLSTEIEPTAASISRFDLDAALWEAASAAGVQTFQQLKVLQVRGKGPFVVSTAKGDFTASALVNASGRWSNLSRVLSQNGSAKWIGLKAHFSETSPSSSVDLYFFPGGYCGAQPAHPSASTVNVAVMVRAEVASTLPEVFELHPALLERSRDWKRVSDPLSVAPLRFETPQPLREDILLAGDAAGFVDPFIGDGISLALRSGELAAKCLAEFFSGKLSLATASQQYASEYQRRFVSVFRASARLRKMVLLPSALRRPMLAFLEKSPALMRHLVRRTR